MHDLTSLTVENDGGVGTFTASNQRGWRARGHFYATETNVKIFDCQVEPVDEEAELTASLLRSVSLGEIKLLIAAQVNRTDVAGRTPPSREELRLPLPSGYVAMSDALLRRVAELYLEETSPGKPPKALKRMAATFDRPPETVRTWISRARKEGWLGASVRGRVGASPGLRLLAVTDVTCGAEPPTGWVGDCWRTLRSNRAGQHHCDPCTERHGAPGWSPIGSKENGDV